MLTADGQPVVEEFTSRELLVASVPAGHAYVRHLSPPRDDGTRPAVTRLPDPDPDRPEQPLTEPGSRWWPPAMLEPAWLDAHDFDLLHLHFGFDDRTPAQLAELVATLRRRRRPLVLTVHDLRSPHQPDRRILDDQLDVLVPAADAVVTLTDGAAAEIERRWGRRAAVVPHPHVVDLAHLDAVRRARAARPLPAVRRVGVAVKNLRANTDPLRLLPGLLAATGPDVRLVVSAHRELMECPATTRAEELVAALTRHAAAGELDLVVHEPLSDTELHAAVAALDVVVLPYRFGTHSGWLEMSHDLGTSVVAPSFGHYADQGVEGRYAADEHRVDDDSLTAAVLSALELRAGGLPGLDAVQRHAQRIDVAAAHEAIYARAQDRARSAA